MLNFLLKVLMLGNIENELFIKNHNELNNSYQVDKNQFIDRNYTNEYYLENHNHIINNNDNDNIINIFENVNVNIPHEKDWRKEYKVSSVKNQGSCGSCWSFSSVGSIESLWSIKHNVLYNLSEQELIDCSRSYGNNGCEGGSMINAFKYVIDNGLCTNLSYPYDGNENTCQKDNCESVIKILNYSLVPQNNEYILKKYVNKQPVSVAIQANKRSFQLYKSGVYDDLDCGTELDHGVLLIGYGYDKNYDMDYWIIKNSWGKNWGENGYIRIKRNIDDNRGLCGIAMQPSIPII